ncbi:hypothetical protein ANN_16268 [Periplaneta americana]|uniref:Odorant receptor n=1 Tax=Periplaneta americana TaxID=6978 RepID=A0ABQ8SII3_PERAM|nr:hypothetical protein ANN_16268 [Periplaneta americana]
MDSNKNPTSDEVDPKTILSLNLKLLKFAGVWWRDIRGNPLKKFLYHCYEKLIVYSYSFFTITVFLHMIFAEENLGEYCESMLLCFCQVLHTSKLIPFVRRKEHLAKLTATLEDNFYIHGKSLNGEEKSLIRRAMKQAKWTTMIYFCSLCCTAFIMILTPPTLAFTMHPENETALENRKLLVFKAWYPFDISHYPYNLLIYMNQVVSTFIEGVCIIGTVNPFYMVLIIYTGYQFELLCLSLRRAKDQLKNATKIEGLMLGSDVVESRKSVKKSITGEDMDTYWELECSTDASQLITTYMKECMMYHQNILE